MRSGLATSLASAAAFNFFHISPVGRFTISDARNWVALAAFVAVAVVVSTVAELARSRTAEAERRREEADLAAGLARELLAGAQTSEVLGSTARRLAEAMTLPSAAIELGAVPPEPRRLAMALRGPDGEQVATLLVPSHLPARDDRAAARARGRAARRAGRDRASPRRRAGGGRRDGRAAPLRRRQDGAAARRVSHDLRTPLTAILAAGHALGTDTLTGDERAELSSGVVEAAAPAGGARRQAARPVQAAGRQRRAAAGLGVARRGAARRRARASARMPPDVRLTVDPGIPDVRADAAQLERAFANLLENARRYSGGQQVAVHIRAQRRQGAGARRRPRPGHRPVRARADLRAVLPRQRGRRRAVDGIGARPRDRQGVHRGQRRDDLGRVAARPGHELRRVAARARDGAGAGGRMNSRPRRPKVLVCDDEVQIVRALRVILRDAGFESLPASTAEEALDVAAVQPPDAAIIDLVLPDGDGVEVCRRLREWSDMPMIVLSAVGDEDAKVRALEAGADDYITKPFGPRELVARLNADLRRVRHEPEATVISSDGLELDLARRIVQRDGEEVHLTPDRVRPVAAAGDQPRPADDASRPARVRVGPGLRRRHPGAARAHRAACARRSSRRTGPRLHPHRPGRRLPLRGLAPARVSAGRARPIFTKSL